MNKLKVTYFQRKPFNHGNFSVEFIFDDVRKRLKDKIDAQVKILAYHSEGLFPRLYSALECVFYQSSVNHVTGDTSFAGIFLSKKKTIQTILDCGFLDNKKPLPRFVLWLFWLYLPVKRAKRVTTISQFVKDNILELVKYDPEKIIVVPVAISEIYQPSPKKFNKAYPTLLHIGTAHNKNILRLIEAIEGIPCHLSIIGRLSNEVQDALAHFKIDYSNCFNISQEEMYQKYIDCDILAFVSTHEGFGMPIVEANATERVVIAGNTTSMPEVAGNAACLINPFSIQDIREGVLKLIDDDEYRETLIENGRANRKRFDPSVIADAYYKIYESIAPNT